MEFAILCLTFSTLSLVAGDKAKTCQPEDFHYEYTECDSAGGRWRVSVPKPNSCIGGAPNPPIRGKDCSFNCKSGQYLDIQGDQECHPCQPGTYSLGGGMKFDDWTHLPAGFSVESEKLQGPERWGDGDHDDADTTGNCTDEGWRPEGDYVAVYGGVCSSSLVYSVTLVQPGTVMFQYQYNDDNTFFHFLVENDRCQAAHDKESSKWPAASKKGEWKTVRLNLKTGLNVLNWKRINFGQNHGPVYVRNIEIEGVAYTSECSPCREGTYSDKEGATFCTLCDPNSHSQRGAVRCTPCDPASEYSRKGAAKCEQRPACTASDYYEYHTPCDDNHKTKTTYKWIQPQICRTDVPESVQLPAEGPPSDCPPCNPGMQLAVGSGCQFCPINTYSDGSVPCRPCPGSTSPNYGYYFHWWNALPQNVTTACFTMSEDACETDKSWIPSGDHIRSGVPKVRDTYFILNVDVGMFREPSGPSSGVKTVYGEVVIVFEANCSEDCHLSFAQEASEASLLQSWEGPQKKQEFRHKVTEQNDYVFSFAFRPSETHDEIGKDNFVKIYSIHVTNLMEGSGGASSCQPCPRGVQDNGCIPCPDGYYIHPNTSQCTACPPNTVIHGDSAWGVETCQPCGNGLRPVKGNKCASDCKFTSGSGREFDFSELGRYVHYIDGSRLFTSSGTQYVHGFNISLCAGDDKFSIATCVNNVTFEETFLKSRSKVESAICRSTMIPAHTNRHMVLSTQPASLGDYLEKIVSNVSLGDMYKEEGFNTDGMENDIHFYYKSDSSTSACKQGRTTIISLRCDVKEDGNGTIDLPPKCSDGTCDGCTFHFLWRTMHACPICTADDYDVIVGECVRGSQTVHYVAPVHCIVADNKKQETKERKCSMVPFAIEIAILVGIGVGIIMCGCLVYCWKKNRKLEYKYMKLVGQEGSGGKYGDELPGVDSCGLDEGEEDEQFDAVHFKESKGKQLLNKLKLKIGGKDDENPFESIALSEKQSLT